MSFEYVASSELSSLFDAFRRMCNDAIRIAVERVPKNRFELIKLAYPRLKEYGLHSQYILSVCEVAYSVYRNKKRRSTPRIKRAFLKLDSQSYQINHLILRIPIAPRNFVFLTLQTSDYQLSFVDDPGLKRGSVTITPHSVNIAFSKTVEEFIPVGCMGLDTNERNVTVSATDGWHHQFNELGEIVEIKERYREIRAKIVRTKGRDRRTCTRLLVKYGGRERNRTASRTHKVTSQIVDYAAEHKLGIKMEKLTGIRRLYRRGNRQGASFRGRMNTWVFGQTQRQIRYKAMWDGVPHWYVNPQGTSRKCPDCGSRVARFPERKLYCAKCDKIWDRDDLASRNVMACAVPQVQPAKGSREEERDDDCSNPQSRWREGKLTG